MKNQKSTQILVKSILKKYSICNYCLGRLISKKLCLKPSKNLGKKFNIKSTDSVLKKCYICKNIFEKLDQVVAQMIQNSSSYEFQTFLVGSVIKPSISDNDDIVKSKFKIKGVLNVKTHINHEISKKFTRQTKSKLDSLNPTITFKINFKDESCQVHSKSLFVYGRYTKKQRNMPQKQTMCKNCQGKGCMICNFHGLENFNSVEGQIAKFLYKKFKSKQVKVNWIGGEDKSSLILGNGRPFFVKIFDPHIRKVRFQKQNSLNGLQLHCLRQILNQPKDSIPFRSRVVILVESKIPLKNNLLKKLHLIKKNPLVINNSDEKIVKKSVYDLKYKKIKPNFLQIIMSVDGGISIKSFVEDSSIQPNLTELLDNECKCIQFDFKQIDMISNINKN